MSREGRKFDLGFFVVLAFLLASIHGLVLVPFWPWRGLDLQNLYAFHSECARWPIPYDVSGSVCGDALGRSMVYPPLMYWAMAWLRFFDFYRAELLWSLAIVGMTFSGAMILTSVDSIRPRARHGFLFLLLFFQLPMVYALDRGNVDALIVPIYCAAIACLVRRKEFLAGVLFATACWLKVYPTIPSLVLLVACAIAPGLRKTHFKPLGLGFLTGGIAWAVLLLPDSYRYLVEVLPAFAAERGGIQPTSHILYKSVWAWLFLKLPILGIWGWMTARNLARDPLLVLSGGLAISTFFQHTSNDYNFVTAYPFLFLVIVRFLQPKMRRGDLMMLVLTILVYVGDRTPWVPLFGNRGVLYFQILWLFLFPFFLDRHERYEKGVHHGD